MHCVGVLGVSDCKFTLQATRCTRAVCISMRLELLATVANVQYGLISDSRLLLQAVFYSQFECIKCALQAPFTYEALPPEKINFVPLKQRRSFNGRELMQV